MKTKKYMNPPKPLHVCKSDSEKERDGADPQEYFFRCIHLSTLSPYNSTSSTTSKRATQVEKIIKRLRISEQLWKKTLSLLSGLYVAFLLLNRMDSYLCFPCFTI